MAETKPDSLRQPLVHYCGSQWAHKEHLWYDKAGRERICDGATTAEKPNQRDKERS